MSSVPRFWRNLGSRYNLEGTRCKECGEYFYPPRNVCVNCRRSGQIEPFKFKGTGEIVTYTLIHTAAEGFESQAPYTLAIIKLDEGPSLTSQVVGDPEKMHIGTVSYTHLRAHETGRNLVCRLLLEKKKTM